MLPYFFGVFSWLDRYVDLVEQFLASKAVLAPLLFLFLEEAGVPLPVPGDMIIAYTGYRLSLNPSGPGIWQAFIAAQFAALSGATILFFLSKRWGQMLVLKLGKFIFLKEKHIRHAERLFARFGVLGIIVGRHIPGLRIPVTVFAATSGVSYPIFLGSTFISTSAWILFYLFAGRRLGTSFHDLLHQYVGLSIFVVAVVVAVFIAIHLIGIYLESRKGSDEEHRQKEVN